MDITIFPGKLSGTVRAIPSKSQAHRLLICAAFAGAPTTLFCPETNRDIEATMGCLNALGADITRTDSGYRVVPVKEIPRQTALRCHDSGSTLRFLLPVAGALGIDTEQVGVKATTEEGLGFTGDGSGMAAHAVALVERR